METKKKLPIARLLEQSKGSRGETWGALAKRLGVTTETLRLYRNGEQSPPPSRYDDMAEVLGVSKQDLVSALAGIPQGDGAASGKPPPAPLADGLRQPPLRRSDPEPYVDEAGRYGIAGTAYVAVVDVTLCAGDGADGDYSERVVGREPYPLQWLRRFVGALHGLRLVGVMGDSMPDFPPNSDALVRVRTGFAGAGIYAVEQDGDLLLKRVNKIGGGVYTVASDNPAYPADTLTPLDGSDSCAYRSALTDRPTTFAIAGKVVLSLKPV